MRESLSVFFASFINWLRNIQLPITRRAFSLKSLKKLSNKHNIRYSIKTAIAVVLSYTISLLIEPAYAFWAPISAIIVMQVSVAASIQSSVDRIVGSLYGAVLGLAAHFIFPFEGITGDIGLFIIANMCGLLLILNPRYRLAGITSITIFLISPVAEGQTVWSFSWILLFHIIVSILVALAVSVMLWPVSGAHNLQDSLKKQYLMAADFLDSITYTFLDKKSHLQPDYLAPLLDSIAGNKPEYRQVKEYEAVNLTRHYPELGTLVNGLEQIKVYLSSLLDALDSEAAPIENLPMKQELMTLASSSVSGLRWIASHDKTQTLPEVRWYIEATSIRLEDLRNNNVLKALTLEQLIQVLAFYNAMNHLAETIANLEEQIEIISRNSTIHNIKYRPFRWLRYKFLKSIR